MKATAAMAGNRVIGSNGKFKIPWVSSIDRRFFKAMTINHPVIVGRTTFESMGILKDRLHYVLSNTEKKEMDGLDGKPGVWYMTLDEVLKVRNIDDAWVIGGAKTYNQLLPHCSDLYLTVFTDEYEGNVYMPPFEHLFDDQRIIAEFKDMMIVHYWKRPDCCEWEKQAYRDGFDSGLMGTSEDDNPYMPSGHERDTTFEDEQHYQWYSGYNDAPINVKKYDWE